MQGIDIKRGSAVPIYRQLDAALRRLILGGALRSEEKLPSTRELARDLGVSRITVKSVYEQLTAEGFTKAKTGAGTFVADGLTPEENPVFNPEEPGIPLRDVRLSDRASGIVLSNASVRHGVTAPFRPGVPALDLFPVKLWNRYIQDANLSRQQLSYGTVTGSTALRRSIAKHLTDARGMRADPDQIVITSGAQQAFVLIAFVLLNQGDTVWYEEPGHIAGRDIMRIMGANLAAVPIDGEGMDLHFAQYQHPNPRVIFTTPSHQQPTGVTMSLSRRQSLLQMARAHDAWIIEDDYDSEFRYRGRPLPALSALDSKGRVIYVGTFSKSMFAAMRLGYVVVPKELVAPFSRAKTLLGQGASPVVETAMAGFMNDGRFVEHIRKMRRVYRDRRDVLFKSLNRSCADYLEPQPTEAGMHMLAWLKNGINDRRAHQALLDAGVESLPLSVYAMEPINRNALVLGFAGVPENQIPKLVTRMSKTLSQLVP